MPITIEMPKLSDTMTEGTLVKWRKKKGDSVEVGDIIAEVETDKATMEMEAFDDGTLHELLVEEGAHVAVGGPIAILLEKGESAPSGDTKSADPSKPAAKAEKPADGQKADGSKSAVAGAAPLVRASLASAPPALAGGRVKASPLAKKVAAERGVNLGGLQGTGPGGRILRDDVLSAPTGQGAGGATATAVPSVPSMPPGENDKRIPLSGMRRVIAERLLASKTQLPHFYLYIEVDTAPLMAMRAQFNAAAEKEEGPKFTVNDLVLKAAIMAAVQAPAVNASFAGDSIIQYADINLAVAVAVDDGLVTPVIRKAQDKSLRELSVAVKDLATRARSKKLKPEEYQGGTFTVSNLGSYGIEQFSAIINPPQAMILAIGAIVKKPVVGAGDQIVAGQRMTIGLSADHRVVDGAVGATYLAALRKLIENPALMFI
jgi:pyruvate dehydrogenase E2 component (dihydrolipoamide acetyltransferase)